MTGSERTIAWALAFVVTAACDREEPPSLGAVRPLPAIAAPGSGQPNLAVAPDGRALLSWIESGSGGESVLRHSARKAGGAWSPARTIASGSGWFVNWADLPAMTALPDGTLVAHWLARRGTSRYSYDVHATRSRDGGATWSAPITPHRDGTDSEHGFVSIVPWPDGGAGLVWLDGRNMASNEGHGVSGATALMQTTLAVDGTLGPEVIVDPRVCDCCQTAAARTGEGVVVAYRDRSDEEVRDISVVRWSGGRWSEPMTIGRDGWTITGCPVNGPAVAADGRRVAVAWFAAPQDPGRVTVAFSDDGGASFGEPMRIDEGRPIGRVDVVLAPRGNEAVVSWMETTDAGADVRVRRVAADGRRSGAVVVAPSSAARSSGFPRMRRSGKDVVLAWTDAGAPAQVRTAVLEVE